MIVVDSLYIINYIYKNTCIIQDVYKKSTQYLYGMYVYIIHI